MKNRSEHGFTLVELSIAMIIIALLLAGVAIGSSIIKQSALRSIITDLKEYESSVQSFREKYSALPGDFSNAYAIWGATCDSTAGDCNGDGNGTIDLSGSMASDETNESFRAWQHLMLAGLIKGNYTGIAGTNASGNQANIGTNVPAAKYNSGSAGAGYGLRSQSSAFSYTGVTAVMKLYISVGASTTNALATAVVFLPDEAKSIDDKMDDGRPGSGVLIGDPGGAPACSDVAAVATAIYNTTVTTAQCALYYEVVF